MGMIIPTPGTFEPPNMLIIKLFMFLKRERKREWSFGLNIARQKFKFYFAALYKYFHPLLPYSKSSIPFIEPVIGEIVIRVVIERPHSRRIEKSPAIDDIIPAIEF